MRLDAAKPGMWWEVGGLGIWHTLLFYPKLNSVSAMLEVVVGATPCTCFDHHFVAKLVFDVFVGDELGLVLFY